MSINDKKCFLWRESYVDYLWACNVTVPAYFQEEGFLLYEDNQLSAYATKRELEAASTVGKQLYDNSRYKDVFSELKIVRERNKEIIKKYEPKKLRLAASAKLMEKYKLLFNSMKDFVSAYRFTEPYYLVSLEKKLDEYLMQTESDLECRQYLKARLLSGADSVLDSDVADIANFLQSISLERFEAKGMDAAISDCAENLLEETARRYYLAMTQVSSCSKNELEKMILHNIIPDIDVLNERKKGFALQIERSGFQEYIGDEFYKFKNNFFPNLVELTSNVISGVTAFPGKAEGRAIVLPPISTSDEYNDFIADFKGGSILVAPMTSPELVPIFRKVVAIVTDEGGITSHAALIAREMKIPCIVGTSHATKIIKSGMKLLVDATQAQVIIQ